MVRKRYPTPGNPYPGRGRSPYGGNPAGYGPAPRQHVPRTGFISGRPAAQLGQVPALPPGYVWAGQQHPQLALSAVPVQAAPALPTLNPAVAAAAGQAGAVPVEGKAAPKPGEQAQKAMAWAWRNRWGLTPVAAPLAVAAGAASDPGSTIGALVLTGAGLAAWARQGGAIRGRMLLSVRERVAAAAWCTVAAAWTPVAAWSPLTPTAAGLVLVAGVAWPSGVWWASRRIRPTEAGEEPAAAVELSEEARQLAAAWPATLGAVDGVGPAPLQGSTIVEGSMTEPAPGTIVFAVEVRGHAETVCSDVVRQGLERALRLPVGTAGVAVDRDDCSRVVVTLTPTRHLEHVDAQWPGPVLDEETGAIPTAATESGTILHAHLHNESGTEHALVAGAPNTGKSITTAVLVLPGVCARREVVIYVDGGLGSSNGGLAGACDWWAVNEEEWAPAIKAAEAIMLARKRRRAALGWSAWRGKAERDPVVTLLLDEAKTLSGYKQVKALGPVVATLAREGRKHGIRVIQVVHDPMSDDVVGGRVTRGLLAGAGIVIAHRPGDGTANTLSTDSTNVKIDLTALPPGAGWVAMIRRGEVLARQARILHARAETIEELLSTFAPRELGPEDAAAAGAAYAGRTRGTAARDAILTARAAYEAGMTLGDVDELAAGGDADGVHLALVDDETGTVPATVAGEVVSVVDVTDTTTAATETAGEEAASSSTSAALNATAAAAAERAAENRLMVLRTLAAGPVTFSELIELTELAKTTAMRARDTLAGEGLIVADISTRPARWGLTPAGTAALGLPTPTDEAVDEAAS